jgi:aspartyl-tRNA(Asn)/glutamyl-tRNA(Gln) amidotransferase subunit A
MDTAIVLEAIAGYDELDATSTDWPIENYTAALGARTKCRIGIVRDPFFVNLDPEIESAVHNAIRLITDIASEVREVDLPSVPTAVQAPEVYAVHSKYFAESPDLYRPWIRERLKQAAAVGVVDYVKARHELEQVRHSINAVFSHVDLLVTPNFARAADYDRRSIDNVAGTIR